MGKDVVIKEVSGKSMLRDFVDFPNILYRDVPEFVPAFFDDDMDDWDENKNPAFEYCEAKAFLAYKDGMLAGRIGAILSHKANDIWGTKRMRFSQVDFINDDEVVDALFKAVEDWARYKGCDEVQGPLGFCDMDREGMLVEGFDKRSMFITYYNYPYYNDQLARIGYKKDIDWIEHKIPISLTEQDFYKRVHRLAAASMKKGGYRKVILKNKIQCIKYVKKIFNLINEAYAPLYGVVDLNERQIKKYTNKFLPIIDPDYVACVVDKNDELVAFGVCAPSMAEALKKCRGKLFPLGFIGILKSLKNNEAVDMLLMAVKPSLQRGSGLNCIVLDHILTSCIKNNVKWAETGPQLETNNKMYGQWSMLDIEPHKRRRCYIKKIG